MGWVVQDLYHQAQVKVLNVLQALLCIVHFRGPALVGRGQSSLSSTITYQNLLFCRVLKHSIHQEDKSFDLLGLSCLKTPFGAAECREVQIKGLASGVFHTPFRNYSTL